MHSFNINVMQNCKRILRLRSACVPYRKATNSSSSRSHKSSDRSEMNACFQCINHRRIYYYRCNIDYAHRHGYGSLLSWAISQKSWHHKIKATNYFYIKSSTQILYIFKCVPRQRSRTTGFNLFFSVFDINHYILSIILIIMSQWNIKIIYDYLMY